MKYIGKMAETESLLSTCCTVLFLLIINNSYVFLKSGILTRYSFWFLCNFLVYKMAKHGKQLPDDTKNTIVQLIEGSYRASEVANIAMRFFLFTFRIPIDFLTDRRV
jgi:hypothetical protein